MLKKIGINLLQKYKNNKEYSYYEKFSKYIDFNKAIQQCPSKIKKICFVIPGMPPYSGGHTSILRLGTYLNELGYDIYYISYVNKGIKSLKKNALINLNNYKGEIIDKSYLESFEADIYIATLWESAYFIKDLKGYKMYFVQDYEPYFYVYGEKFLLAKNSYELGLHIVSLGKWNKDMIERNCEKVEKIDTIDFPYEKSDYKPIIRDFKSYTNKKEISIAAYVKFDEKRAPFIIQVILENVKNELYKNGIILNINYFGAEKNEKFINGVNLGKLNKEQLCNLYNKCDFGMVASLTNISLVPYEMIATKLPVIEFEEGTFKYFFDENCAILTSLDWKDMYDKLMYYINNPNYIEELTENSYRNVNSLSWKKSTYQFKEILDRIIIQ